MAMIYCQYCNKKHEEDDVPHRREDNTFSAGYGEYEVVVGGTIDLIAICPDCGKDLEEVVE